MGVLICKMEDYEGVLDYFQKALNVQEEVMGKTHPDTLATTVNMANTYMEGLKDFTKAEEIYRLALDGREKALGKGHEDTKKCASNLAILLIWDLRDKETTRELIEDCTHLLRDPQGGELLRNFMK